MGGDKIVVLYSDGKLNQGSSEPNEPLECTTTLTQCGLTCITDIQIYRPHRQTDGQIDRQTPAAFLSCIYLSANSAVLLLATVWPETCLRNPRSRYVLVQEHHVIEPLHNTGQTESKYQLLQSIWQSCQ